MVKKLDIAVGALAFVACLGLLFGFPVWGLFFGWCWYFVMGGTPDVFKRAIPPMILGYALASIAILAYAISNFNIWAVSSTVAVTVFVLMLSLKTKVFGESLPSFNAYSCLFVGYYAGTFPQMASGGPFDIMNLLTAVLWIALSNVVGLVFGFVSVRIGSKKSGEMDAN
jgi:hypothetical protein